MYEIGGRHGGFLLEVLREDLFCARPASFWWLLAISWVIGSALQSCLCPGAFSLSQFPSYRDVSHWIQV